jgi:RecG-like helicase
VADPNVLDAHALQNNVERHDCVPIDTAPSGQVVTVTGRLKAVVYTPRQTLPTFSAELFDGSASIELVFLGRRRIAGLEPGRTIVARGRVGEHDGHKAIYNPWYVLREPM